MNKEPTIGHYLDEEKRELIEAIESEHYKPGYSILTPEHAQTLKEGARRTMMRHPELRVYLKLHDQLKSGGLEVDGFTLWKLVKEKRQEQIQALLQLLDELPKGANEDGLQSEGMLREVRDARTQEILDRSFIS